MGEGLLAPRLDNMSPVRHEGAPWPHDPPKGNRARQSVRKHVSGGTTREPSTHMSGRQAENTVGTRTVAVATLMA